MALILTVNEKTPVMGSNCYIAENATVVGDVVMGDDCSVWFQAVVRGDVHSIRIGHGTNIQDGAILHCTYQQAPLQIGNRVSIGHRAIVHGCTLHDDVLVGMGAIIMDHAEVHSRCIIGAGAVVTEKMVCEEGGVYAGVPARRVKDISPELVQDTLDRISKNYIMYASWFQK